MRILKSQAQVVDEHLKEMALTRWDEFKQLINLDTQNFIICIKSSEGQSVRQIAQSMQISKDRVHRTCKVCPEEFGKKRKTA